MATYIVIHRPSRPNCAVRRENPAEEIVKRIRAGKLATTNFGGWDINRHKREIQENDRLLFYRSGEKPTGFFAVGRVLPADHCECRKLREEGIRDWYDKPADLSGPILPGSPVYSGLRWDTGKEGQRSSHINAVWEVVGDPDKGQILVECNINKLLGRDGPKRNGEWIPDKDADAICAKCEKSPNALRANPVKLDGINLRSFPAR